MNETSAALAALAAAGYALDALCERVDLSVKFSVGAAGVAALHTLGVHRIRSALTTLPHVQRVNALGDCLLRLRGSRRIHLDTALLAEQEAADDALRAALVRS